jgi:hypothetical protein
MGDDKSEVELLTDAALERLRREVAAPAIGHSDARSPGRPTTRSIVERISI